MKAEKARKANKAKKVMLNIILSIFILIIFTVYINAAFIVVSPSARSLGMGNAFVAVSGDSSAIYSNPAGLVNVKTWEALFSYNRLYMGISDISENLVLGCYSLKQYGTVGAGYYGLINELYSENVYYFVYAFPISNAAIAVNVKYLQKVYAGTAWVTSNPYFSNTSPAAVSAGFSMFAQIVKGLNFGFFVDDFNQPNTAISGEEKLPMSIKTGLAGFATKEALASLELSYRANEYKVNLGGEYTFSFEKFGVVNARGGFGIGTSSYMNFTLGLGTRFNIPFLGFGTSIDYGFLFPLGFAGGQAGTHKFSLTISDQYPDIKKEIQ